MGACASARKAVKYDEEPLPPKELPNEKENEGEEKKKEGGVKGTHERRPSLEDLLDKTEDSKEEPSTEDLPVSNGPSDSPVKTAYVAPVARASEE